MDSPIAKIVRIKQPLGNSQCTYRTKDTADQTIAREMSWICWASEGSAT